MAFLYEKSSTWRKIVAFTRRSPLYMAAFAGVCIGGPMLLGNSVMKKTNPDHETDLERQLRAKGSYHAQALAKAQRERLQVMFDELKAGGGEQRYAAALDGKSLGTHSTGTTKGAVSIQQQQQQVEQTQRQQHAEGASDTIRSGA